MMSPRIRKLMLMLHITFSVGWLGAVLAYIALATTGLVTHDTRMVKVVYPALELVGWYVIVPAALAALLTGLIQSLGSNWGLFRCYWVLVKFILTFGASIILVNHMPAVSKMTSAVNAGKLSGMDFETGRRALLVHAVGGLSILIITTVLSVYKPWGKIIYRLKAEPNGVLPREVLPNRKSWGLYMLFGFAGLVILFVILHLIGGGMKGHH